MDFCLQRTQYAVSTKDNAICSDSLHISPSAVPLLTILKAMFIKQEDASLVCDNVVITQNIVIFSYPYRHIDLHKLIFFW